jgi:hypothetical protein
MPKSLGGQIPDTAPCIAWLAIVCSIMGGRCAVPFSNVVLNLRVFPVGGVKGSVSARQRPREDSFGLSALNAGETESGHVQEQSIG